MRSGKKERDQSGLLRNICMHLSICVISLVFNKFRIYAEFARMLSEKGCSLCPCLGPVSWPEALSINDARKFTLAIIMQLSPVQGCGRASYAVYLKQTHTLHTCTHISYIYIHNFDADIFIRTTSATEKALVVAYNLWGTAWMPVWVSFGGRSCLCIITYTKIAF